MPPGQRSPSPVTPDTLHPLSNPCICTGHYGRIPADSETARHLRECHGISPFKAGQGPKGGKGNGSPDKAKLEAALDRLFADFGPLRFLAYWQELWSFYVRKAGVAHMGELDSALYNTFTAATMARTDGVGKVEGEATASSAPRGVKRKGGQSRQVELAEG